VHVAGVFTNNIQVVFGGTIFPLLFITLRDESHVKNMNVENCHSRYLGVGAESHH
jgi:hypothetical protein